MDRLHAEQVFDADNRDRLLMGLQVLTNIRIVIPYSNEPRQRRQRFIEELSIALQSGSYTIPWSEAGIETGLCASCVSPSSVPAPRIALLIGA